MKYFLLAILAAPLFLTAQITDSTQREIKLQGAINFRDLGGYQTADGKHVKWGKIYRSAALDKLSEHDLDVLQGKSIAVVADFRGPYEVKVAPDKLPKGATRISLPSGSEHIGDSAYMKNMVQQMANDSFLTGFYSDVHPFKERYKPMFDELLTLNKDSALLFHCTAGKDRTGIGAALVLYALGVDTTVIMKDYLATNYYRAAENERAIIGMVKMYGLNEKLARNMMAARESYLDATFASINQQYGSVDNFLKKEMGLDKKKLKKLKQLYLD
ncbi:MAG: tyrosine-protein phosphatase [Agriterribacter sp.]